MVALLHHHLRLQMVVPLPSSALLERVAHEMHLFSDSPDPHATCETLAASSSSQLNHRGSPELRHLDVDQVAHDFELSPTSSAFSPQVNGYSFMCTLLTHCSF